MIRTVGIVSLSSGILGEPFVQHEVRLGLARLQDYGLQVRFLPHARAGLEALRAHPEWRAEDLLQAFRDPEIESDPLCHRRRRYLPARAVSV